MRVLHVHTQYSAYSIQTCKLNDGGNFESFSMLSTQVDFDQERFLLCHYNSKKYKEMEGIQERVKELQRRDFYTLPVLEEVVLPDTTGRSQRLETGRCRKTGE